MADLFISHASNDAPLVDAIVQLIEGGVGIRSDQIFCTSLEELGIPPGVDFKAYIKEKLGEARTVIAVVSPQYYNSAFCMCELGATWALAKNFVPLLVPPIDYHDLRGSLFGTQALAITESEKLDSMHTVVVGFAEAPEKVTRWNSRKSQFLQKLPEILKALKPVSTLTEMEAKKLKAELDEYKQEFEKADAEISRLKQQIAELSKAKDRDAVEEIKKKFSKGFDLFTDLLGNAQSATRELPEVVREALYYEIRGEEFLPDYDKWHDQPQRAAEDNLLAKDDNIFSVKGAHPKVKRALEALWKLQAFLDEPPEDFPVEEYEQRYQDLLDMTSRAFWKRHKLL
jgi:hypothetical protein